MIDQVFKASIDSILTTDVKGLITQLNPAAEEMLGYLQSELIGKSIKLLYALEKDFETVSAEVASTGKFKGEIINKTKSGSNIIVSLTANLLFDQDNNVSGMMGISRNITSNISLQREYERLTNSVTDIIFSTNLEGYFTYINEAVKKALGYESKELIDTLFIDLIYKPHLKDVNEHYHSQIEKNLDQSYIEFQVIKKDGNLLWVGQHVSAKFDLINKKNIVGFYGVVREIDKQKKTEISLTKSEEKYRELFDSSSDLIQSIDMNGNILYVNKTWKQVLGYSDEEIKQLNLFSLIHPNSQEHCSSLFKAIIETGKSNEDRVLYELIAKNGKIITLEGALTLKTKNEKAVSIQTFLRDVTLQKSIEKQIIRQEKTLRQITETISDVFYLYNIIEKKYEYISTNCKILLGISDEFFYSGKSHTHIHAHSDDKEKLQEANKAINAGKPYDIDYRIIVNDEIRWINEKSFPIGDEKGGVVANSGICRDITDLRLAQETIHIQNIEIGASILYAKRLQDSVLPTEKMMTAIFPDSFILYKAKDIVSGDFYVVDYLNTNNQKTPAFIVGDCTGHGIPGAVLSLMCNVLVRESFTQDDVNSPSEAIDFVRNRLVKLFKSNESEIIRDGMDIAFCVLDKAKNQLHFSGGNNSCVLVRDKEIIEYKGDRQHVGYSDNPKPFTNHIIDIKVGDVIFLYTDGYIDQFGGEKNKKYTKKRLHQFLLETIHLPMQQIGVLLESKFIEWKKDEEQIDDMTFLGIRI